MFAAALEIIFWTSVKAAICLSAFCLPLVLLIITRRTLKNAERPVWVWALAVANIILALNYGCLILSRQMDTLYATAFVGYATVFVYVLVLWLIKVFGRAWRRLFGSPQVEEEDDRIGTGLLMP
ncbi:MAG: hypothetical protein JWO55_296 [Candidatus Saccharibacteria bacterium]|nr:hypothetical protein [Candidatus Saccharibacteria bacterium]